MNTYKNLLIYVGKECQSLLVTKDFCVILESLGYLDYMFFNNLTELKPWLEINLNGDQPIPAGIIADLPDSDKDLLEFFDSISKNKTEFIIPFILYHSKPVSKEIKKTFISIKEIDDIFEIPLNPNKLISRIEFLSGFKKTKLSYKIDEEENEEFQLKVEDRINRFSKRFLDVIISIIFLLIFSPILLIIALIIKIESKGSIFYCANRAGSNYKVFKFLKFRTMYEGSERKLKDMNNKNQYPDLLNGNPIFVKIASDPRVTTFGTFLRKTSLDELPQLINVLKGEMSLVGNRPLPLYEAVSLTKDEWAERFLAPAGITGLWQVTKRGGKNMSAKERINLDIEYANKNSFIYDLLLLIKTPRSLFQNENV